MNLIIKLPDEDVQVIKAKATAKVISADQYALEVLEQDLAAAVEPQPTPKRFDNLSDLLLSSPFAGANLDLERSEDQPRTIGTNDQTTLGCMALFGRFIAASAPLQAHQHRFKTADRQ